MGQLVSHSSFNFLLLVILLNILIFPFLSLLDHTILDSILRRRVVGSENPLGDSRRRSGVRVRGRNYVDILSEVGCWVWGLIPLVLGADNSAEQDIDTVTKDNE